MDYTKFPKDRDGFNGPGRQMARFLDTVGVPYLRTKMADGGQALKKGDRLYTRKPVQAGNLFLAFGAVGDVLKRCLSFTARGVFDSFTTPTSGDPSQAGSLLTPYGKGLMQTIGGEAAPTEHDFAGNPASAQTYTTFTTVSGREYVTGYSFVGVFPFEAAGGSVLMQAGEIYQSGTGHRFVANVAATRMNEDGQYVPLYILDFGGTEQVVGETLFLANRNALDFSVRGLGRGARLMHYTYQRTTDSPGDGTPNTLFTYSTDAGENWQPAADGDMFADLLDIQAYADSIPGSLSPLFNRASRQVVVSTCRVSARRAVVLANVPYLYTFESDTPGTFITTVRVRIRLGQLDLDSGFAMTSRAVLYDGHDASVEEEIPDGDFPEIDLIAQTYLVTMIPFGGGALIFTRNYSREGGGDLNPWRIRFTADGVTLEEVGTMPKAGYLTGLPSALDERRLVCPMWDGKHSLYQSDDRGATWTRRATIFEGGDEPSSAHGELFLQQFHTVFFQRLNGRAASITPGAPWVSDSRLPAPP